MKAQDLAKAQNPDMRAALGALRRAAQMARATAIQTNTHLVVMKDGRIQRIAASVLASETVAKPSQRD